MNKFTFSRFIFLDTGILSDLCIRKELYRPLFDYLSENDLTIAVSDGLLAELSQATRKHDDLELLFTCLPSAMIKSFETILHEEIQAYPNARQNNLLHYPLSHPSYTKTLREHLSSKKLAQTRNQQLAFAKQMKKRHFLLKPNFKPTKKGSYTKEQVSDFARQLTKQWLRKNSVFKERFGEQDSKIDYSKFRSLQLYAHVLFYKFYLGGRTPKKTDFGDLYNIFSLPYCEKIVLEKDLHETFRQIKLHTDVLSCTHNEKTDFIDKLHRF